MKKIIGLSLVAGGLAFAQSGLMGGTSGIHQLNAYTLGQWGVEIGTGGDVSFDSWSLSRGGAVTRDGKYDTFHEWSGTFAGNFHAAIGLLDFLDLGASLPMNYDHANLHGGGESGIWAFRPGDLDIWLKANVVGNEASLFAMAAMVDVYLPTGTEARGVRPRHAWYLSEDGEVTDPYTSGEVNVGGTLIFTLNFGALGVPVVWNTHAGFVYAGDGQSTLVYGTGVNYIATDWLEAFVEFSGEMRVETGKYRRDPMDDPMRLTPGLRFHLPWNIDFAMGVDIAIRTLANLGYDYKDEMHSNGSHLVYYENDHDTKFTYGYAPTPTIAGTAALIWRMANKDKDEDKDGVIDSKDQCAHTPAGAPVDTVGCPLDTDADGVPDYQDKCPNTLPGVEIDKKGCPLNKKEDLEQLKKGIQFQTGSAKLTKASYKTLDDIIALMKKIKVAHLEVQGHTDNTGSAETNKKLSQARAQAVVDYFLQKGIEEDRVRAVGFGPDKPIADNKTKKGRAQNRRVELVPFQL